LDHNRTARVTPSENHQGTGISTLAIFLRRKISQSTITKEQAMSEYKPEDSLVVEDLETMDLSKLDEDSQIDIMLTLIEQYTSQLEARGISTEIIDTALFSVFVGRLAERGDRESFEAYVEEAMEETWDTVVLH
jgi:hypothetical protein